MVLNPANNGRVMALVSVVVVVGLFHFLIPAEPHSYHIVHIVLRKLYFLPPVMAAAWFGLRGAAITTLAVSVLFAIHAFLDWPGNYMEQANQVGELASFWAVGLIPGWLFDRRRALLEELARANEETLLALVSSLDLREHDTERHSQRVRQYALLLADRLGLDENAKRAIGFGALLHDVGKIAVPDAVLLKPSGLNEADWRQMRQHPATGYRMLKGIGFLSAAAEIVHAHHERYDGSGYPRGLKGEEIPLGARLFAVVDVYDALTSARPYHQAVSHEEAMAALQKESGTHFDPAILAAFSQIEQTRLTEIQNSMPDPLAD